MSVETHDSQLIWSERLFVRSNERVSEIFRLFLPESTPQCLDLGSQRSLHIRSHQRVQSLAFLRNSRSCRFLQELFRLFCYLADVELTGSKVLHIIDEGVSR